MDGFLRKSTASQSVSIGPFISDTDFKTVQTGLTIANTDIKLMVNGAASASKNSGGGTHRQSGHYGITFDATDTATVGQLRGSVVVAGALPVWFTYTVVEAAVFDDVYAASATGVPTAVEVADAFLDRDMSTGTDSGSTTVRTPRQALRHWRNKVTQAAGTVTVCKEDDATTSWTYVVTTDAAAIPIIGIDPAGP